MVVDAVVVVVVVVVVRHCALRMWLQLLPLHTSIKEVVVVEVVAVAVGGCGMRLSAPSWSSSSSTTRQR